MGWCPARIRRCLCVLRYWNRLILLDENRLTKKIFQSDFESNSPWCKRVKTILSDIGLVDLYSNKMYVNIDECRNRMSDKYCTEWLEDVKNKPKLRTYAQFKNTFGVENYVTLNLTRQQRSMLAQIRSGILPINVETGRFRNIARENRLCTMCDTSEVEDELHFTLLCPFYNEIRKNYLHNLLLEYKDYSLAETFKILCEYHSRLFSKFIVQIWNKRKDTLYNNVNN